MRAGGLWRCGSVILMPDIGVSLRIDADEKSLRAFKVGRLESMASEIIDIPPNFLLLLHNLDEI